MKSQKNKRKICLQSLFFGQFTKSKNQSIDNFRKQELLCKSIHQENLAYLKYSFKPGELIGFFDKGQYKTILAEVNGIYLNSFYLIIEQYSHLKQLIQQSRDIQQQAQRIKTIQISVNEQESLTQKGKIPPLLNKLKRNNNLITELQN